MREGGWEGRGGRESERGRRGERLKEDKLNPVSVC